MKIEAQAYMRRQRVAAVSEVLRAELSFQTQVPRRGIGSAGLLSFLAPRFTGMAQCGLRSMALLNAPSVLSLAESPLCHCFHLFCDGSLVFCGPPVKGQVACEKPLRTGKTQIYKLYSNSSDLEHLL